MQKVMIDLDETIVMDGYLKAVNDYKKTNYKAEDIDSYYVEDILGEEKEAFLDYFYKNVNIYKDIKELPNAINTIKELNKYYDVYICAAFVDPRRVLECSVSAKYKYEWIIKNMPFIDPKKIILTGSKDIIMCDIKIDDKVANLKDGYGKVKLLLDHKHNQKYSFLELESLGIRRVYNWDQIRSILLEGREDL